MIIGCVIVYVDTPYFLFPHIVVTRRYTFLTEKFRLFPNNIVHYIWKFKNFFLLCQQKGDKMEENKDIRWIQRLNNDDKALARLQNAAKIIATEKQFSGDVDDLLKEGLVQALNR